jgi:hypothetical protein
MSELDLHGGEPELLDEAATAAERAASQLADHADPEVPLADAVEQSAPTMEEDADPEVVRFDDEYQ